jgi:uncharacterized phage protein gp47/JayE
MARQYADKTSDNILASMLAKVPDSLDKREGSIIYDALAPAAIELEGTYTELDNVLERGFVDTATDEDLELRTKEQGVERKPAATTIRFLQCDGPKGKIEAGKRFLVDDVYFVVRETISIPGSVKIESEEAGSHTVVDYNAEVLSLEGIDGLERASLVFEHSEDFNGVDAESDEDLRQRYYVTVRRTPGSGNIDDYVFWCGEVVGVGKVIVQPLWDGPGTVKITILDSNGDPASPGLVSNVKEYLDPIDGSGMGKAPIGAHVTVEAAMPTVVNIIANISVDGTKTVEDIEDEFELNINKYFTTLLIGTTRTLILKKVGAVLVNTTGVSDYEGILLNGANANIILGINEIPRLGTVTLSEV